MSHYTKAPIIEAVIQVAFSNNLGEREVERVGRKVGSKYANGNPTRNYNVEINVVNEKAFPSVKEETTGWQVFSSDAADSFVVNRDYLLAARRAPYTNWEEFFARFKRDFETAMKTVGHHQFSRLGVRYINRIDVPIEDKAPFDISRYCTVYPRVPASEMTPFVLSHCRFEYMDPDNGCRVVVQTGNVDPVLLNHHSFLVDVDLIVTENIALRYEELFAQIENLRSVKNNLFELIITDETRKHLYV